MRFRSLLPGLFVTLCFQRAPVQAATETVAVLPFFNSSTDPNLDWIGESIGETIRESLSGAGVLALSRDERLEVYRRLSVRAGPTLTHATVFRIGESLDAAQVIYGRFEVAAPPSGDRASRGELTLTADVINLREVRNGPRFVESGKLEDLSLLESRLAWQAIKFVLPRSAPAEDEYLRDRPPVRIDAVESYIRGLLATSPDQKQKLFVQSAKLDSRFSEPVYQLGRISFDRKDYRAASGWLEKVASADSHFHEAQFLMGLCRYYLADYEGAAKMLGQVAALVPLNEVFNDLGAAQAHDNKPADAIEAFSKAVEGDESDPDFWFNLGYAQWKTGRSADAAKSFRAVLDRTPDDVEARDLLGRAQKSELPRPGERLNAERIKENFEETLFLQLKAVLKK